MTLPSVDEQKRIAAVLGALDDKIDSNRHVAVLLEETAGTLFRARFVDFIEVDQAEASRVGPVDEEFELLGGGTPKTSMSEYWDGGIPWIAVKDIGPGVFITQTEKSVTKLAVDQRWVRVYPAETAVISARGTVGSVGLMAAPMTVNQSCYAVRGRGGLGQIFVYFRLLEIVDRLRARSHGSVFPTITRDTFSAIMVTHPDASAHGQFERLTRPLFDQILALTRESATLTAIRDAVLPKLISGQIRVPDTTDSAEVIEPLAEQVAV